MTRELLLVRHAIAHERDPHRWPDDTLRPLTPEGKRRFRKAAAGLAHWAPRPDRVFTSPLVRARETAQLLCDVARWPTPIELPALAPPSSPSKLISVLRSEKRGRVAFVGHEPCLSGFLSACVSSVGDLRVTLKKGGIALIGFPDGVRAGSGELLAFFPPRALRTMA